jgi:adenine-specific DNA-methyltransferase
LKLLKTMPDESVQLVVTSPPYNIGKPYEERTAAKDYARQQRRIIKECVRVLRPGGSICWQVGNQVLPNSTILPLDILFYAIFDGHPELQLRNRIVWHYEHGLHARVRFSGRYETALWYTKGSDYTFNLDAVRVPQKYPGKRHFRGPNKGKYSGNPLGKNPGDLWVIPNVKHNHIEKTIHPCQFPIELIERFVLALTDRGDRVLDPFMGVGTSAAAALLHGRTAVGAENVGKYYEVGVERIVKAHEGTLRVRPRARPVYVPEPGSKLLQRDHESDAAG